MMNNIKLPLIIITIFWSVLLKAVKIKLITLRILKKITKLDKAGWEAWKNKNGEWFEINTTKISSQLAQMVSAAKNRLSIPPFMTVM